MRKLVSLLVIIFIFLSGCRKIDNAGERKIDYTRNNMITVDEGVQNIKVNNGFIATLRVIKVDGCEYLVTVYDGVSIVHKANCPNPEHGK